jgi:hypothetical protein
MHPKNLQQQQQQDSQESVASIFEDGKIDGQRFVVECVR